MTPREKKKMRIQALVCWAVIVVTPSAHASTKDLPICPGAGLPATSCVSYDTTAMCKQQTSCPSTSASTTCESFTTYGIVRCLHVFNASITPCYECKLTFAPSITAPPTLQPETCSPDAECSLNWCQSHMGCQETTQIECSQSSPGGYDLITCLTPNPSPTPTNPCYTCKGYGSPTGMPTATSSASVVACSVRVRVFIGALLAISAYGLLL